MTKLNYREYYQKLLEESEWKYPELEDKYCPKCGAFLVHNSISYWEGFHIDGCPNDPNDMTIDYDH